MAHLGRYRLVRRLAIGGMADLFLAREEQDGAYLRTVVIKTVRSDEPEPDEAAAALRDEAKVGQALEHPGVVRLLDAELEVPRPHLVLEFVFGRDLARLVVDCRRGMPVEHVVTVAIELFDTLDYTYHRARLGDRPLRAVHRDVSPQNVMVAFDGTVRLLDFGLAKGAHSEGLTQTGVLKGKFAYMAPEQLRGVEIDHRTDLYGAGVLLWELLTGARLHARSTDRETVWAVVKGPIPWPGRPGGRTPWLLGFIIWRCLRRIRWLRPRRGRWIAACLRWWDGRTREERRTALRSWMRELHAEALARRDAYAATFDDPDSRRKVLDAGFELVPQATQTRGTGLPQPMKAPSRGPSGWAVVASWLALAVALGLALLAPETPGGRAMLRIEGAAPGTMLRVNGRTVGRLPGPAVWVEPGLHEIQVGREPDVWRRTVRVKTGQVLRVQAAEASN